METILIDTPLMLGYIFFILGIVLFTTTNTLVSYGISAVCLGISIFCYVEADTATDILKIVTSAVFGSNVVFFMRELYNKYGKEEDKPSDR